MTTYRHANQGTCSRFVDFDIDDGGRIHDVSFMGGCNGNLQGIGKLVEGMAVGDVIARLEGISCGGRPTSCPDQLAQALKEQLGGPELGNPEAGRD